MGNERDSWSPAFIARFKDLYGRYGRDVDCYPVLQKEFRTQYPKLVCSQLTRLRLKRKKEFDKSRESFIIEIRKETSKKEKYQLVKARDLNSRIVEELIEYQEEQLETVSRLDPIEPDYQERKLGILKLVTSIQKELNAFSGLDFQTELNKYAKKLIQAKLIEEQDVEFLKKLLIEDGSMDSLQKEDEIPKITFIDADQTKEYEEDESDKS